MTKRKGIYNIALAAVLCAIGIVIPMTFPKIYLPPASFTLASHVAIFIAIFLSPGITVAVCVGTTIGFIFSGLALPVWLRAGSHIIFALIGAFWLKKNPDIIKKPLSAAIYAFVLSLIHATCEVLVILPLYFGDALQSGFYESGFMYSVVLLVGVGTLVHSLIDFTLSIGIWKVIEKALKRPTQYG